jgi:pimeloyl-ACP methyl ester carboxylesterase
MTVDVRFEALGSAEDQYRVPADALRRGDSKEATMDTIRSKDGTTIAFDKHGSGPALILVAGATSRRSSKADLADVLAPHFSVYNYDRRGRGGSGDTAPYAVDREIEDIDALIDEAGGSALLYGHSSGGCLALDATVALGDKVKGLAVYEVPYNDDPQAQKSWGEYITRLTDALTSNRRGDAVALFMAIAGAPEAEIESMRKAPFWGEMEAVAPTLAYDHTYVMGKDGSVPMERAAVVRVPTLLLTGGRGAPFMLETARTLSKVIPRATLRTLNGQTHVVQPEVLAPVLVEYFAASSHRHTVTA